MTDEDRQREREREREGVGGGGGGMMEGTWALHFNDGGNRSWSHITTCPCMSTLQSDTQLITA